MPELRDTYHAALQHGHVTPADEDLVVGVVRRPSYGIENHLDENVPELAPPEDLLSEFKTVADERDDLTHDEAWDRVDFGARYRDHLRTDSARTAMDDLLAELGSRDVWLVCYENTDNKRCHRTILRDVLRERHDR
ncbi:DUF488 domain-containing protein [Halorussus gelatinilyticus]|uniref:DUF488 domain-containing protein n=1 Tax=Halorussus gelatinilyticus TaxID=2937524 RepID=A0A8U0IJB4_9EURY|nr:DUF488 domain-containing protein [Halorussus gelatinilyticus]UPW00878.1 DUF488 domain-containing protein [Halorussus gelatinilyticus]